MRVQTEIKLRPHSQVVEFLPRSQAGSHLRKRSVEIHQMDLAGSPHRHQNMDRVGIPHRRQNMDHMADNLVVAVNLVDNQAANLVANRKSRKST